MLFAIADNIRISFKYYKYESIILITISRQVDYDYSECGDTVVMCINAVNYAWCHYLSCVQTLHY